MIQYFTWTQGRRPATAVKGSITASFTYNESGIRTSKTVNGVTHEYVVDGTKIISDCWFESTVRHYIAYIYDAKGVIGMAYRNNGMDEDKFEYFIFKKNLQGDIIAVYDEYGFAAVTYTYDAWGNVTETLYDTTSNGQYNSFRYRGYFYDEDTELYYLNSRYYDPATGRFLNADIYVSTGQGLDGYNMYAYCRNEPVFRKDAFGTEDVCVTNTEDDDNPLNDYGKSPSGGGTGGGKGKSGKWVYEKAPYHNKGNSVKSPAPKNGQAALDNSVEIPPNSNGRVGISEGEIVVLRPTSPGVYHGYVVQLEQLTPHMRRALFQAHMINKRGFIICG